MGKPRLVSTGRILQQGDAGYHGPRLHAQRPSSHGLAAAMANSKEALRGFDDQLGPTGSINRRTGYLIGGLAAVPAAGMATAVPFARRKQRQMSAQNRQRAAALSKSWAKGQPFEAENPGIRGPRKEGKAHVVTGLPKRVGRVGRAAAFLGRNTHNGVASAALAGGTLAGIGVLELGTRGTTKDLRRSQGELSRARRAAKQRVGKAKDRDSRGKTGALLATGTGAGAVAVRANAIANAANLRHERRIDGQITERRAAAARAKNPVSRDPQGRPMYQSGVQRQVVRRGLAQERRAEHTAINLLGQARKKVPFTPHRRGQLMHGAAAIAVPSLWLGARGSVDKADVRRRDVDAGIVGGAAGAGLYQEAGYALKPLDRRAERKIAGDKQLSARARDYRKQSGLPNAAPAGHQAWRPYFRNYPKDLPGGRLKRALAVSHTGKTGVAATALAGGLGAAMAGGASARGRKEPVRKALYEREERVSPMRALGFAAGGTLAAYGLGHSKMVGRGIARGVKMAQRGEYHGVADALQRANAARGSIRAGMAPGEAAIRRVQALNEAIERVPRSIRPEVALVAGTMLASNATPVRRTHYRPVSYPVY